MTVVPGVVRRRRMRSVILVLGLLLPLLPMLGAGSASGPRATAATCPVGWQSVWGAAQFRTTDTVAPRRSFRLVVSPHGMGDNIRIRLSNRYGVTPLRVDDIHVAHQAKGADTVPGDGRSLTFAGRPAVAIASGEEKASDPVDLEIGPFENLSVSFSVVSTAPAVTGHFLAQQTSYSTPEGMTTDGAATSGAAYSISGTTWPFLAGIDAVADHGTIGVLGDSITDGAGSTEDTNRRWPDYLQRRLLADPSHRGISVLNSGWTGNQVTRDHPLYADSAVHRLDRDVLDQPGVRTVIVLEGGNDIGGNTPPPARATEIIDGYKEIIARAKARGDRVLGATLTPMGGNVGAHGLLPGASAARTKVNDWIRTSGAFDAVIDADRALRDKADPERLAAAYDSGDGLHPNDAGHAALANAVPLDALSTAGCAQADAR